MELHTNKIESEIIIRYLQGKANKEEELILDKWLKEDKNNKSQFEVIKNIWDKTNILTPSVESDSESAWNQLNNSIKNLISQQQTDDTKFEARLYGSHRKSTSWILWTFRAAALLLIGFSLYWVSLMYNEEPIVEPAVPEITFYEAVTRKGEKLTIKLADGSTVYLNAESKLVYPRYFDDDSREVMLTGEAFFEVKSSLEQPFRVVTGSIINEVKGTTFNVKYRKEFLEVVVTEGSVMMKNHTGSLILNKGEYGSFTEKNGFNNRKRADIAHFLAWKNNKLSFKSTPLADAMDQVELYFNINVTFTNDNIKNKKITGFFDAESLDEVLESIELAMDVSFVKKGRNIFVY